MCNAPVVMIVDDHPLHLMILSKHLKQLGVTSVVEQSCASQAVLYVKQHHVDVIFCDLLMPDQDGIDLLIELNGVGYRNSVVLLSALETSVLSSVRSMCQTFAFDVIGAIRKPYNTERLRSMLQEWQRGKSSSQTPMSHPLNHRVNVTESDLLMGFATGQIQNYYQTIVDYKTQQTVGVEVLVRWVHPQYGVLTPDRFFPLVEECQLFNELFDIVMLNSIQALKFARIPSHVSINVSHFNIENPNFARHFLALCSEHDIDPTHFTVEITETDYYKESFQLFKNVSQLRVHGVSISIDDFGTGYSSLLKLSRLPFNELKIDQSFVKNIISNKKNQQILSFISHMAHSLELKLVAEGIEDKETYEFLKKYKIDLCQGYYFSRPLPLEHFI
ncbi:EAL domain-containing response regulator [Vibrio hippocampi]|uniref:Sensor histidine kinase RcsC n=1 Tax=Vibrio hippocampi TaxID=654686 RepID=A0ABN8DKY6_9VIBR|nr:EAL domain-containing response regulator [Vibrio hippocampi]CAH0530033.1 Sensor histidine kinase RcsC [Vibrio hippocampi]